MGFADVHNGVNIYCCLCLLCHRGGVGSVACQAVGRCSLAVSSVDKNAKSKSSFVFNFPFLLILRRNSIK